MILKNVLGAHIRVIPGYAGTRDIVLAMHRGEVNGECGMYASSIKAQFHDDVKSGRMKLVIQMGPRKSTEFGNIPSVYDYAKTDDDRAVLDIYFKQLVLGRPLAGPPNIPPDRLKALREASWQHSRTRISSPRPKRSGSTSTPLRPTRCRTC